MAILKYDGVIKLFIFLSLQDETLVGPESHVNAARSLLRNARHES